MSIRSRLVVLVLVVLLPALGAASWVIYRTWEAGQAAQGRQARDSTRTLATVIDREFSQHGALARVLAASPLLDGAPLLTDAARAGFEQTARRATAGTRLAVQLVSESVQWLDTRWPEGAPPRRQLAGAWPLSDAPSIATLGPAPGAPGEAYVAVLEPVQRGARAPAMNLRVLLPVSQLQALVDQTPSPPGWTGLLLDAQGRVVLRHAVTGAAQPLEALYGHIRESIAGRPDGRLALQTGEGAALRVYFSRAPRGWTYVTVLPREGIGAALSGEILRLALGALLLLALAVGGALWVARDELRRRVAEAVAHTQRTERWTAHHERAQALGRLTGRVAHEFNNLLGVISNSAHLIQRHADSPALAMPVSATLRAVEGASRLTQHLLRLGGRQSAQPRTVSLGEWLPGLREVLAVVLGKRIALTIEVPDAPLYTRADPEELELAVINLALNAREVLLDGGRVAISAGLAPVAMTRELPAGTYVFITVRDDGPGLDAAQARRAFEPFFTTKDREPEPEAGFGLSQVHALCAQAGGRAVIASQPGRGTAISLVLPAVGPDTGPVAPPRLESTAPLRARVLLTEDNDSLSDVTAALIENMGASVERATHAAQALARLERGPEVDVVLTDVSMPGEMDGLGLARAVRARWPRIRVVLISAYGQRLAGADSFTVLGKPCTPHALLAALRGPAGTPHAP